MKKFLVLVLCLFSFNVMAAPQVITITVPEAKVAVVLQGYLSIYPNTETKDDPAWVDPGDGSEPDQIAKYSNAQWVRESVRRNFVRDVRRGLEKIRINTNRTPEDNGVAE